METFLSPMPQKECPGKDGHYLESTVKGIRCYTNIANDSAPPSRSANNAPYLPQRVPEGIRTSSRDGFSRGQRFQAET